MRWSLLLKSPDLILLFLFSDQRWLYHQHWLVREEEQGILGACWRAVLLWLVVCPGRLDHDTLDVFHLCGVFSTISMIMVYSVIRGESFTEGVLGVGGARIWFFVCFLMSFASFTGKHILNVWKDLDLAQDNIFRKSFQLEINIKTRVARSLCLTSASHRRGEGGGSGGYWQHSSKNNTATCWPWRLPLLLCGNGTIKFKVWIHIGVTHNKTNEMLKKKCIGPILVNKRKASAGGHIPEPDHDVGRGKDYDCMRT